MSTSYFHHLNGLTNISNNLVPRPSYFSATPNVARIIIMRMSLVLSVTTTAMADRIVQPQVTTTAGSGITSGGITSGHASIVRREYLYSGARSCAATACHGGDQPGKWGRIRGDEFVYWLKHDPHARAYEALASQAAERMMKNLGRPRGGQAGRIGGATRESQCLHCHSPLAQARGQGRRFYPYDGVSCEVCHGPSENWLTSHFRRDWNRQQAILAGQTETKNLLTRAETCVPCHVGSADADVNHDLIAAGHPPLRFELSNFHDLLPKHWDDQSERQRTADFKLRLWAAGQATSLKMALQLLQRRAEGAIEEPRRSSWPELADYDCLACHHDLTVSPTRRQQRGFVRTEAGSVGMRWDGWYYTVMAAANVDQPSTLSQLTDIMQQRLVPDPAQVRDQVATALAELSDQGSTVSFLRRYANVSLELPSRSLSKRHSSLSQQDVTMLKNIRRLHEEYVFPKFSVSP